MAVMNTVVLGVGDTVRVQPHLRFGRGVFVEFHGSDFIVSKDGVQIYPPPVDLNLGLMMPTGHAHAGWIYGGLSQSDGKQFYVAPKDSGVMRWREAMDFAARERAALASDAELDQVYKMKDIASFKGTFNESGLGDASNYWSSLSYPDDRFAPPVPTAHAQRFTDGVSGVALKDRAMSIRLVRKCIVS
jgi:hypothetical protein